MEDENYRNLVVSRLNKTLDKKIGPDDHIDDIVGIFILYIVSNSEADDIICSVWLLQCVNKSVWKGMLKLLQAVVAGLEVTFSNQGIGGMASAFQVLEIAHTHYWAKTDIGDDSRMDTSTTASTAPVSQVTSGLYRWRILLSHLFLATSPRWAIV